MIKPFVAFAVLLVILLFSMSLHYGLFPYSKATKTMQEMTALTHMTHLSLSVGYDESVYNSTYPEMTALGRMDFVYER
ncbi:MAG: hypothetical protein OQK45_01165 [Sulfurovum sp.]|nr:hypothetical protein [Sulfurovum sp.]